MFTTATTTDRAVSLVDLTEASPFRPAEWRLLRARTCDRKRVDPHVRRLRRFLLADMDPASDPALGEAYEVWARGDLTRSEIEARILADQPPPTIAVRTGLPVSVVEAYELSFFDVRPRLGASGYIYHTVLQRGAGGPFRWDDVDGLWKWLGYKGGGLVLDTLIAGASRELIQNLGIDAYLTLDSPLDRSMQMWILAERLPVPTTPKALFKHCRLMRALCDSLEPTQKKTTQSTGPAESPLASPEDSWNEIWLEAVELVPDLRRATPNESRRRRTIRRSPLAV